jgi:type III restriction enzyme
VWYDHLTKRCAHLTTRQGDVYVESFFERPILNSPYAYPDRHWELDDDGQPTNQILPKRRDSKLLTPVPKPQRRRRTANQPGFVFDSGHGLSTEEQEYNPTPIINEIRRYVEDWRNLPNHDQWQVTPETARLLQHWRHNQFQDIRPFEIGVFVRSNRADLSGNAPA